MQALKMVLDATNKIVETSEKDFVISWLDATNICFPNFSKGLKKYIPILNRKNSIADHQYVFTPIHGTPQSYSRIIREKIYRPSIFLDVKHAFDRV